MSNLNIVAIIPARFASTRFPGKPLIDIGGKSMIQRVYEQAKKCKSFTEVYVATDDERIHHHVLSFNGRAILTSSEHRTGTERCAEAIINLKDRPDVVFNVQGDEPFIDPQQLELLANSFSNRKVQIATLAKKISDLETLLNPNVPKVNFTLERKALYFSRSPIPFVRDAQQKDWMKEGIFYKHIGIYAYQTDVLIKIARLPPTPLEIAESLEQLRWLENGYTMQVEITEQETISIDSIEDLKKIQHLI